jgi:hypothetical protein
MYRSFSCSLSHIHLYPYSTLHRLDSSGVACRSQDDPRILPLLKGKVYFVYFTQDIFFELIY